MTSDRKTLPSGKTLQIGHCPYTTVKKLFNSLLVAAKGTKIDKDIMSMDVTVLKDLAITAATSEDVERCLFECFQKCTYDGIRIDSALFDDPKYSISIREDYFVLCWLVIEYHCSPFFIKTFSWLKGNMQTGTDIQK